LTLVLRSVVHDDDFYISERLGEHRIYRNPELRGSIPGGHYDREVRLNHDVSHTLYQNLSRPIPRPARPGRDRKSVERGPGKRIVEGGSIRLADEVRYIQQRAANHDGRIVTIGQLMLFSTETGDAWLLDRTDLLAARLARDGEAAPIQIVETAATFAIEWTGSYRINGPAFVYSDRDTGRVITILGYPTDKLVGIK
jgi:hypothetical protein